MNPLRALRARRGIGVAAVAAAVIGGSLAAALPSGISAAARTNTTTIRGNIVTDAITHHKYGIVPAIGAGASSTSKTTGKSGPCIADPGNGTSTPDCTALSYSGGPVVSGENDYLLFWVPSGWVIPSSYKAGLSAWLSETQSADYTTGNPISVNQQYYQCAGGAKTCSTSSRTFVPYNLVNKGVIVDTDPYPTSGCTDKANGTNTKECLNDSQIRTEIAKYVSAHHLPTGLATEYFLFTPNNVGSCFDSGSTQCAYSAFCGYHSAMSTSGGTVLYANMPWAYNVNGCDVNLAFGAGYANADAIDSVVGVFSHELSETMTDPEVGSGWTQHSGPNAGYEIGDKCAYVYGSGGYGSLTGLANNGLGFWNQALGSDQYLMQLEFSNFNGSSSSTGNCVKTDTQSQPTVSSVTPTSVAHGVSTTFTASLTASNGLHSVLWIFGDGSTSTTTTNTVHHTYATAGSKTLTVIVTDNHGNEKKFTHTITVS